MWSDNETERDLLNFRHVADIAAERIVGARGEPLSIGLSGSWGVGKSSMMKLLRSSLAEREGLEVRFVEFNAWLYQGFDDTRAALMEAITQSLIDHAEKEPEKFAPVLGKLRSLAGRVNLFRVMTMGTGAVLSMLSGDPTPALVARGLSTFKGMTDGEVGAGDLKSAHALGEKVAKGAKELLKDEKDAPKETPAPAPTPTPQKAIQAFRDDLEASLAEMGVTLVVLIDDLDRCLPETAIATLEAMRLFLFLKGTAFVIAADEEMIRQSVRVHFRTPDLDDNLVTNYFDKLIQLPIRVPPLGTQDVRAYLMMLFVDASDLAKERKEEIRSAIGNRLGRTWTGDRVDKAFVLQTIGECDPQLQNRIALAERIAPILTSSSNIAGNPRLIKRFLNTLTLRASMAASQGVGVDEEVLVKLLLFERCGDREAYALLLRSINDSDNGHPFILKELEDKARGDDPASVLPKPWSDPFLTGWLRLDPPLAAHDLRGAAYVSRENHPIILRADELSPEAAQVLEALMRMTSPSMQVTQMLMPLPPRELATLLDKVLAKARQEAIWGTPAILNPAVAIADLDEIHSASLVAFLGGIPGAQLTPAIVPRIADKTWGPAVLAAWRRKADLTAPMRKALAKEEKA